MFFILRYLDERLRAAEDRAPPVENAVETLAAISRPTFIFFEVW